MGDAYRPFDTKSSVVVAHASMRWLAESVPHIPTHNATFSVALCLSKGVWSYTQGQY